MPLDVEIKELIDTVNSGVSELRKEIEAEQKGSKARDALTDEKLNKITESVTKAAEDIQKAQERAANAEKAVEDLKTAFSRLPSNKGKTTSEIEEKSKKAFDSYIRKGDGAGFTVSEEEGIEIRAMSTEVNPDGGYLVMPELANFMVTRAFETSPLRSVARVITTSAKSLEVPIDDDEAAASWVGEGATTGETNTPVVGKKTITAHKIEATPKVTTEMLQDPFVDIEAWLRDKVSDKFSRTENTAFFTGDGVSKPRGILTFSNWAVAGTYERTKIEQIALGNSSALTANGLIDLQAALKEAYQPRATWLMKRATFGKVLQLAGADNYFFSPTLLRDGQANLQMLGKNVIFCDDVPAVASNNLAVVYGDFSVGYTILDRVGLQVLRDPFTAKGFVLFYSTKRTGGDVTNYDSIKIGKVATSV